MSEFVTKADILEADDRPITPFDVPEWGGKKVRLRGLDAATALAVAGATTNEERLRLIARAGIVGEDGKPLFGAEETDALMSRSLDVLTRITEQVVSLSRMTGHAAGK